MPVEPDSLRGVPGEPGVAKPDPDLVVDGVRRYFGGIRAVDVDHLEIQRGTITALIGPNGAGKTTLFNVLTGFDLPQQGHWHLDGGPLVGISAFRIARLGMVRTFQLTKSLSRLTVLDNMLLARQGPRRREPARRPVSPLASPRGGERGPGVADRSRGSVSPT